MKNILVLFLMLLILGIGSYVRIAPIVQGDVLFLFDQGRDLWDVKKIVFDGDPTLIGPFTGLAGVFNGPYHYYLLALPILLGNGDPMWGYYFNALVSVVGIVMCYILGSKMHGRLFGVLIAVFFALAKASVGVTVFFWNPNWIPALMIPFVYFLWKGLIKKDAWGLVGAGFWGGVMVNVEAAYGVWLLPIYLLGIGLFWREAYRKLPAWLGMGAYALHFVPHIIFDLRNNFLMTRAVLDFVLGKNVSLGMTVPWAERLGTRFYEMFYATGGAMSADELMPLNYVIFGLVLMGVGYMALQRFAPEKWRVFSNDEQREIWLYVFIILSYYCCFMFYSRVAWPWYWIGLQTVLYFLFGYLVWIVARLKLIKFWAYGIVICWIVLTVPFYFRGPDHLQDQPGKYSHMMSVVSYIFAQQPEGDFAVYTYTPPIYDFAYSYLFWWQARIRNVNLLTDYEYKTGEERRKMSFLILEPAHAGREAEIEGFLKTKTPPGKDLRKEVFPGKITVIVRESDL